MLDLPTHSSPAHAVVVYDGIRYQEEHLISCDNGHSLDISQYDGLKEPRFEHSPADNWGNKKLPQYRSICRKDGVWFPFNELDTKNFGLPEIEPCTEQVCHDRGACTADRPLAEGGPVLYIRPAPEGVKAIPVAELILDEVQTGVELKVKEVTIPRPVVEKKSKKPKLNVPDGGQESL